MAEMEDPTMTAYMAALAASELLLSLHRIDALSRWAERPATEDTAFHVTRAREVFARLTAYMAAL